MSKASQITTCFFVTLASVPVAFFFSAFLVQGQDLAGQGMYGGILFFLFIAVVSFFSGGYAVIIYLKNSKQLGIGSGVMAWLSVAPLVLILMAFLGLLAMEYS